MARKTGENIKDLVFERTTGAFAFLVLFLAALLAREREILCLLAQGLAAGAISRRLCISAVTVRNHIQHLIRKLGLHSQIEAVAYAYRNNLVGQGAP